MTLVQWIGNAIVSLLAGSLGGVLVAGSVARRGLAARRRDDAEVRLTAAVRAYRALLTNWYDSAHRRSAGLTDPASRPSQETFADTVLRDLPSLPRRKQAKARDLLLKLVGAATFSLAEEHVHVPSEMRSVVDTRERVERALMTSPDEPPGLLNELLRSANDDHERPKQLRRCRRALDELADLVKPWSKSPR